MKRNTGNIEATIAALRRMTVTQLRQKYLEVFGESANAANKEFLVKRIAWRIQSLAEGGLSERARKRAEELARDADLRVTIPKRSEIGDRGVDRSRSAGAPIAGTVLTRKYKGQVLQVTVLDGGFDFRGEKF